MKRDLDCTHTITNKKDLFICSKCKKTLCPKCSYFYVDESNISITKNAKPHCLDCAKKAGI